MYVCVCVCLWTGVVADSVERIGVLSALVHTKKHSGTGWAGRVCMCCVHARPPPITRGLVSAKLVKFNGRSFRGALSCIRTQCVYASAEIVWRFRYNRMRKRITNVVDKIEGTMAGQRATRTQAAT